MGGCVWIIDRWMDGMWDGVVWGWLGGGWIGVVVGWVKSGV